MSKRIGIIVPLLLLASAPAARAFTVSAAAGADDATGTQAARTRGVVAVVDLSTAAADVLGGALRYDDSQIGTGCGILAGAGITLTPETRLRATVTRFIGDGDFRGWRTRLGPRWDRDGRSLAMSWQHDANDVIGHADGALLEAGAPVIGPLGARMEVGWSRDANHTTGTQASLGAVVMLGRFAQLTAAGGLAQRTAAGSGLLPSPGGGRGGPILPVLFARDASGGSSSDAAPAPWEPTTSLGIRILLP